jgi:hypothetical protein
MPGVLMSPEFAAQVVRVVKDVLRRERSPQDTSSRHGGRQVRRHWAICNANINGATNGATTPSTGTVEILTRNDSGNLVRSGITHTLTHRWEHIDLVQDQLIQIERFKGEWVAVGADCQAMGSPPA